MAGLNLPFKRLQDFLERKQWDILDLHPDFFRRGYIHPKLTRTFDAHVYVAWRICQAIRSRLAFDGMQKSTIVQQMWYAMVRCIEKKKLKTVIFRLSIRIMKVTGQLLVSHHGKVFPEFLNGNGWGVLPWKFGIKRSLLFHHRESHFGHWKVPAYRL